MCGLVGIYSKNKEYMNEYILNKMSKKIIHRGPDGDGTWLSERDGIGMAHRRLSVIDLSSAGAQPMMSFSKRFVISFNGEIYNFKEIKNRLKDEFQFNRWKGNSDTEVLLNAIELLGLEKTLNLIDGMFAFALWDKQNKNLTLVRDRFGEKPLYFGKCEDYFLFASELKSLVAFPLWNKKINKEAVSLYLRQSCIPSPKTIYKGIFKLEPSNLIVISDAGDNISSSKCYWDLSQKAFYKERKINLNASENIEKFEYLLKDSIKRRTFSDVPVGAFLSGGYDSSLVVALMNEVSSKKVRTFSIGFNNQIFNEAKKAKKIASHFGTQHEEVYFDPEEAISLIPQLPYIYDEPFADSSQLPTLLVSKLAKKNVTVCLSGDGGDEFFGGYNRHIVGPKLWKFINLLPVPIRKKLSILNNINITNEINLFNKFVPNKYQVSNLSEKISKILSLTNSTNSLNFYKNLTSNCKNPNDFLSDVIEPNTIIDKKEFVDLIPEFSERMMYLDQMNYMSNDILTKVDRSSMAVSLETRLPFLDYKIAEFSWEVPISQKISENKGKWLLRQVLYKYLPKDLVDGPKMGFTIPLNTWLKGPLMEWADDLLSINNLEKHDIFDNYAVRKLWEDFISGKSSSHYQIWDMLMFQSWLKINY